MTRPKKNHRAATRDIAQSASPTGDSRKPRRSTPRGGRQALAIIEASRWSELEPEAPIAAALGALGPRAKATSQNKKRRWSEQFAHHCAVVIANELRRSKRLRGKRISPVGVGDGTETLVPLSGESSKRIDVVVADALLGLVIGISLKGFNFKDGKGENANYDKNLTGRTYELSDEVRLVHEHLPKAFMTAIFFLPVDAATDKTERAPSSFARAVSVLKERTGRLDPALSSHMGRCDSAYVALYSTGADKLGFPPGLLRLINVLTTSSPRRGRPAIDKSMSLAEVVAEIVANATKTNSAAWADPEPD
jgi:hypothetical protein